MITLNISEEELDLLCTSCKTMCDDCCSEECDTCDVNKLMKKLLIILTKLEL